MISKIIKNKEKWRKKYNSLCIKYAELASKRITELEKDSEILLQNIELKYDLDSLKRKIMRYEKKYGKLEGGDEYVESKDKGK